MTLKSSVKKLLKLFHAHKKEGKDIVIVTLPRTGSTLLAEILNVDKGCKVCSEPFGINSQNIKILNKYLSLENIQERYTDVSKSMIESLKLYFNDLSEGKTWNSYYWSDLFSRNHKLKTNRTIFKTHKLTYVYEDLFNDKDHFVIYLMRHPISHSLSRIRNKWSEYSLQFAQSDKISNDLNDKQKKLVAKIVNSGNELEKFVLSWCLENYIILKNVQNNKCKNHILISYEELIYNSEMVLKDICERVNLEYRTKMLDMIKTPSNGIVHSTESAKKQILKGEMLEMISKWREKVSSTDEQKLFKILYAFNIDIFKPGEDLPDKKYRLIK